jgi:hypothetical protein
MYGAKKLGVFPFYSVCYRLRQFRNALFLVLELRLLLKCVADAVNRLQRFLNIVAAIVNTGRMGKKS